MHELQVFRQPVPRPFPDPYLQFPCLGPDTEPKPFCLHPSGLGRVYNGEGVRGLTSSFLIAGGRGVICSLWKVNDAETARFMEMFYQGLSGGARPAEALRDIRRTIADQKAPADWAAFILVGD